MTTHGANRAERAFQLLASNRADLAVNEFRAALSEDPTDGRALAGLALSLSSLDKDAEALEVAKAAVSHAPDDALSHAALAQSLLGVRRPKEALEPARHAVELDPFEAWHHGLVAVAQLETAHPKEALESAERGLAIDAESQICLNARGMALVRLNRRDDAEQGLRWALSRQPESAVAHTTLGHTLLLQGRVDEAATHFREALRRDPSSDAAREGLLHTLRGRHWPYRIFIAWMSFCARMPRGVLLGVLLASFLLPQILAKVAGQSPWIALAILPVRLALLGFVLLTWIGMPLFNAMLLFTRDGRLLLRPAEKAWAIVTVLLLVAFVALVAASIATLGRQPYLPPAAVAALLLLAPIGAASSAWYEPQRRNMMLGALAVMVVLAGYAIVTLQPGVLTVAMILFLVAANVQGVTSARAG